MKTLLWKVNGRVISCFSFSVTSSQIYKLLSIRQFSLLALGTVFKQSHTVPSSLGCVDSDALGAMIVSFAYDGGACLGF